MALAHAVGLDWIDARLGTLSIEPPSRLDVTYVSVLEPDRAVAMSGRTADPGGRIEAPPRPAIVPRAVVAARAPVQESAASAASAEMDAAHPAVPDGEPLPAAAEGSDVAAGTTIEPPPAAAAPPPSAAEALAAADVDWPPSTRVRYVLTGHYQGEIHGFAEVEWLRVGERYQVHLEVLVGLPFAPLLVRRMSSDGVLSAQGLQPMRYDETTRMALRAPRTLSMRFDDQGLRLADGRWSPRPEGVQDTASQFVQMTWLFTRDPSRLALGRSVEFPLALPRRLDTWTYDVVAEDSVYTPFGSVAALHLKPRPPADRRDMLIAEAWFSPQLRYLPVRLLIHQDESTWIDLVIAEKPQVAAR